MGASCYFSALVDNARIARIFEELADLLELAGESPFKLRAYRAFAETARALTEPLAAVAERGELEKLDGVGKAIAAKVVDLLATGTFKALDAARAEVPASLLEVLRVPGLGAKSVRRLWQEAGVTSLGELLYACEENRLAKLSGFGGKKQDKTHSAVQRMLEERGSMLLAGAVLAVDRIAAALRGSEVVLVGDARRGVETVREATILVRDGVTAVIAKTLMAAKNRMDATSVTEDTDDVVVLFASGELAHVRPVPAARWVAALLTETGSPEHVAWLRVRAAKAGGFDAVCSRSATEEDVYETLGLPFAPAELREGETGVVPEMVEKVEGIFHVHTEWSDGAATIDDMARETARAGFTYLGITDHSKAASYANGLDEARLREQATAIAEARRNDDRVTILHGIEVDILVDGTLDLDDDALSQLDFVIASVHSRFNLSHEEMTARIVRAVSHPLVTILGHPTGRLLLGRSGYTFDIERVAKAAAANDTYLEINANPQRLDLSDANVRIAAAAGAKFAIDPDAHSPRGINDTSLGVRVARRAALTAGQVLNSQRRDAVVATLAARKKKALQRLSARA
jgi:DNA polymerase (family 10)